MQTTYDAATASERLHTLAEGPVWDDARQQLLWVDIPAGQVLEGRLIDEHVEVTGCHTLPHTVGAVVPAIDGGLLVAGQNSLLTITPGRDEVRHGPAVLPPDVNSRLNDGACDPAGRFLVGSLALDDRVGEEALYRLDLDGSVEVVADGLTLSNGLGWSADGRTLYHVDSVPGVVWSIDYDIETGRLGTRQVFIDGSRGTPDGLCLDVEGNLWIAFWGAGEVRCFSTQARPLATVRVPAPNTSSVAFVGAHRDRLLITTARKDLSPAQLQAYPDSGRLFLADVHTCGPATPVWGGST